MTDRRCKITGNECGTDTWTVGQDCECVECQAWILEIFAGKIEKKMKNIDPEISRLIDIHFWELI